MSQPSEESQGYVYRRAAPPLFKVKKNLVDPDAFRIQSWMKGLSVYRADVATPYNVLEARLDEARMQLFSEDEDNQHTARIPPQCTTAGGCAPTTLMFAPPH